MKKLLILAVVIFIGYYLWNNSNTSQTLPVETSDLPTESMTEEEKMTLESSLSANLLAVGSFTGTGEATTSWSGTTFSHSLTTTLSDPAEGTFYEGWLVRKSPTLTFISTGKLKLLDGQYGLSFTSDINYPDHLDIVVTQETTANGLDNKPEAHVLEGALQ